MLKLLRIDFIFAIFAQIYFFHIYSTHFLETATLNCSFVVLQGTQIKRKLRYLSRQVHVCEIRMPRRQRS